MINETNINKLALALNKAQTSMTAAKKDKSNPFFKSKYADLSSVFLAVKDAFSENGLSVTQLMEVRDDGRMILKTILLHASGQNLESCMCLPDIQDPQKIGSAITYFRRYSLMSIAGIPADDDDGNTASAYTKTKEAKATDKIEPLKPSIQKIGMERAVKLAEKLNLYPDYHQQIKDFLAKNKTTLEDLSSDFADRIQIKLNKLDVEHSEAVDEKHG
jgi:hypothetical protein